MINERIDLQKEYGLQAGKLECICMEYPWDEQGIQWRRPAVIVVPGGAYAMVSKREGEPIANAFLARGFQAFVLTYPCRPQGAAYPEQLLELGCAVDYIKKNAQKYSVNPEEIFVVGFSAGGHLTANLAVEWNAVSQMLGREVNAKPTAVGLCYPVISEKYGYAGTHENLLHTYSQEEKEELIKKLDLDESVTEQTAPSFLWTTTCDSLVPVTNTLRFAEALAKNKVNFEVHIYPFGQHGGANCSYEINPYDLRLARNTCWLDDCAAFFRIYCEEKY